MRRFFSFIKLVLVLTLLMFGVWLLSATFLPEGILRGYFSRLFEIHPILRGQFTFWGTFLANFLVAFLGIQFMNLFKVGKTPGGLYVLPVFWILYGLLLGTNSFVFAADPVPFSISILWTRTGFNELLAYTLGYEASRNWALWEQRGLWRVRRLPDKKWNPQAQDLAYWLAGLLLLILAVTREVR